MLLYKMVQYKTFWIFFLYSLFLHPVAPRPKNEIYENVIRQLIDVIKRRYTLTSDENMISLPDSVEDLPYTEPLHPGHTLLQPSSGILESSVKYPHKETGGSAVYGNLNNLGIKYGKTSNRVLYTGFRKANDLLSKLLTEIYRKSHIRPKKRTNNMIIIEIEPSLLKNINNRDADDLAEVKYKNNGMEILDDASNEGSSYHQTRRQRKRRRSKFRDRLTRNKESSSDDDSTSSDASTDYEHNPGNPYTIHKDKYKQNWLWNHFMDGNHMNVNPYAPPFNSMGPSGTALFFGRKWWYFNQDDFKPLN